MPMIISAVGFSYSYLFYRGVGLFKEIRGCEMNEYESESESECLGFGTCGPQLSAFGCATTIPPFLTLHYFYTFILFKQGGIKMTASGKKVTTA